MVLIEKKVESGNASICWTPRLLTHILSPFLALLLQVKDACDQMTAELLGLKATLAQSQQREKKSASLVQELTAMVKEQKNRITDLIKAKREAVTALKVLRSSKDADRYIRG